MTTTKNALTKCKRCGGNVGTIKLTDSEEIHHFGHYLTDAERGYCSQRCMRMGVGPIVAERRS